MILLLSCAFLAGMVVTALIYAWDARTKEARLRERIAKEVDASFNWCRTGAESQMSRLGMLDRILRLVRKPEL